MNRRFFASDCEFRRVRFHVSIQDFFGAFQKFRAGNQDDAAAASAFYAHIAAELHDFPFLRAARVRFLHLDDVADFELNEFHLIHPFLSLKFYFIPFSASSAILANFWKRCAKPDLEMPLITESSAKVS